MKPKFVIVLLLIIQSAGSAQAIRTFGVKGGAVTASQTWDYISPFTNLDTERRWGIDIGGVCRVVKHAGVQSLK